MNLRKIISLVLVLAMVIGFVPVNEVYGDSYYTLGQMKAAFPHGKYWNHKAQPGHGYSDYRHYGDACGDVIFSVSDYPCYSHSADAPVGYYDCNSYYGLAIQCAGFARLMADLAFTGATNIGNWSKVYDKGTAIAVAKPGDVIHYKGAGADANYGHWAFIIGVNGSTFTFGECGVGNNCNISWGRTLNINGVDSVTLYRSPEVWTGNVENYYLDLNGILDGATGDSANGFGTADVYVNGALVADDVSDYYSSHTPGSTYEITDIKAVGCNAYKGNASYVGTLNSSVSINLEFETYHDYKTIVTPATCTEGEKHEKTCKTCGISTTEDASLNPQWSEWSSEKPNVHESRIETKLQIRHKQTEVQYSKESSIEGWTYVGTDWNDGITTYVDYVENWPAGFDRNNVLYSRYNNAVPSAYVSDTKKVVVDSITTLGYVYWHWCSSSYNGTYPINRYISDCYGWDNATSRTYDIFHAFASEEYKGITAGKGAVEYYHDGACLQTYWWQPALEVKKASVTTYEKMNKFTRDMGWSEWEDMNTIGRPDESNTEIRTVYRYVISGAPATGHSWDRGVVIKPATENESGIKLLSCKDCDETKEVNYDLSDYTSGDVNADGKIDASDALLVLKYAARLDLSKEVFIEDAAYTNAGDVIDASDALNILKYAARIIDVLPVE